MKPELAVPLLALAAVYTVFSLRHGNRVRAKQQREWEEHPPPPDEGLDESVLARVPEILERCGDRRPAELPGSVLPLAPKVRAFLETWSSLDFDRGKECKGANLDGVFFEYERKNLAVFAENPAFAELGGDGGEQRFYVRRDPADETVYVVDLEVDFDYAKPRPYASDIDRWVALRCQDHRYDDD